MDEYQLRCERGQLLYSYLMGRMSSGEYYKRSVDLNYN